ncbi:MAG: hypothetical protein DRI86_08600 [Bacteroidetes bacterium]|nr:MAG: hypothetical protein DRI86_08600 [Bacteroidota bacterium]
MKKYILIIIVFGLVQIYSNKTFSQTLGGGEVHGSFQADAQYYNQDTTIGADKIPEAIAVNAFMEMRYTNKNFEAGMRYELFMPQMQGYDSRWKGNGFGYRYLRYKNERVDVTAGNFYEQFGSGMILRSYQEWNLGFDNSLDGVRVKYKMKALTITGLVAKQRYYWDVGPGLIRGVDGQLSFNDLFDKMADSKTRLFFGYSFVSRYQSDLDPIYKLPENVAAEAARMELFRGRFHYKLEVGWKINDPNASNNMIYKGGNAVITELGYSQKGFGFTLQAERVDNMDFRSNRASTGFDLPVGYIPAMTRQHAYSLAAMYPYASQANSQMGLQATLIYKIKKKSTLGGKYGTNININYSIANSIYKEKVNDTIAIDQPGTLGYESNFFKVGDDLYFTDFNIKIQRKLSRKWNVSLMYMNVFYNMFINEGHAEPNVHANIFIGDFWWKFKPYNSLHLELQALATKQDEGNWTSAMLEYNNRGFFAAVIMLFNQGEAGQSNSSVYPFITTGYTRKATRISVSYGKQREGIVCVGGVCRAVPASNGFALSINSSF